MAEIRFIGLDIAKDVFHLHGACLLYTSDAADE